jgi:hypothetical protein
MKPDTVLVDKAFDADERVIEPLLAASKIPVIPPKGSRKTRRDFDMNHRYPLRQDRQKLSRVTIGWPV